MHILWELFWGQTPMLQKHEYLSFNICHRPPLWLLSRAHLRPIVVLCCVHITLMSRILIISFHSRLELLLLWQWHLSPSPLSTETTAWPAAWCLADIWVWFRREKNTSWLWRAKLKREDWNNNMTPRRGEPTRGTVRNQTIRSYAVRQY